MDKTEKIYVAGHRGLVGSAIVRALKRQGYDNLVLKTREELDLTNQTLVADFFSREKPSYVFLAAAKVGGILSNNTYPAEFIYQNLQIQNNVIERSYRHGVKKLLLLGSSCIYPKDCPQPMREEHLLTGSLEPTNEPYAIAKIAGIKMCQSYNRQYGTNFIAAMPTNLYGQNDNFDLETSHVLAAMIRKFHEAKVHTRPTVTLWGTGTPVREFLLVDDLADACIFLMNQFNPTKKQNERGDIFLNVGTGKGTTVAELATLIQAVTGFAGGIEWDATKPNGMAKKVMDSSRIHQLGWRHTTELEAGLRQTYRWFSQSVT
ncbi:MAG: GDP-fucose synthetase [Candidatus Buchananbacteria bacterium RIFCSPHIGHO2_02_FULL_56_16]|uniref:GDP-L-fucose synthase n=1 Tax=Candidatus Buchananbacteria bacterium RIFCSPHIGHO2_02_FULL_56_16 TaxID=1797542 RepID=A0A1G1YIK1_9BACT|nr:MAG: GDP-fucose synthetase [Candidatus Buchananbacteria bacterium RIFCSPHIGHO2_02_FULL_56_16]